MGAWEISEALAAARVEAKLWDKFIQESLERLDPQPKTDDDKPN